MILQEQILLLRFNGKSLTSFLRHISLLIFVLNMQHLIFRMGLYDVQHIPIHPGIKLNTKYTPTNSAIYQSQISEWPSSMIVNMATQLEIATLVYRCLKLLNSQIIKLTCANKRVNIRSSSIQHIHMKEASKILMSSRKLILRTNQYMLL